MKTQKKVVRNLEDKWLKYQTDSTWKAFKWERYRYRNIINYHKTNSISGEIIKVWGDAKKLYQVVNEIAGCEKFNPLPKGQSDSDLAEDFATYFLEKIQNIRKLFKNIPSFKCKVNDAIPRFTKFGVMTSTEVHDLVMDLKIKSCELDPVPTKLIKHHLHLFLPILTKIINCSLTQAIFGENWKCAIVRPLLKKLGLDLINKNYRPVSNLSFTSKLVEKVALKQFTEHCNKYRLLPDHQSAYKKGYSCETSVLKLVNDALWNMENRKITVCAFLDLSAAFDTVDHDLLLYILHNQYAISEDALKWYESYLWPRGFKVCIGREYSRERSLSFSIPQGSSSGANIFVAYCASYSDAISPDLTLQGFADDHFIRTSFDPNDVEEQQLKVQELEKAMSDMKVWMDQMRLKLNPDKTEFVMFGHYKQMKKVQVDSLNVGSDCIQRSDYVKCLGSWLDTNLNMKEHVKRKAKVAMYNLRKIRTLRKYLTSDASATLVLTLVMSHIDYCNSILIEVPEITLKPFQRIQNIAAKLVLNRKKSDSSTAALRELNWLPVRAE